MKMSQLLAPTLRDDPNEAEIVSHKLLLRAGYIRKLAAGIYNYLPLGFKVLNKVSNIIREEMNLAGAQEVFMPVMLPKELWDETGRWEVYGKELFRVRDRHDREFCLGPTHEEIITDIVRGSIRSYRQLPVSLFQIQTKFRDEIRPRFGLMRGREFMMKDCYSFHTSNEDLDREYQNMHAAYCRIFSRLGLNFRVKDADAGLIGGHFSQEFMVLADSGEEEIVCCTKCDFAGGSDMKFEVCPKCQNQDLQIKRGIEVGHIFKLGVKYSEKMKCNFLDENNQEKNMIMGCYGIGVSRTCQAAIEQSHDKDGIIWPLAMAPFQVALIPVNIEDVQQREVALKLYEELKNNKVEVLLDDRLDRMGVKLKDIDLIGVPIKVILGKALKDNKVEIKMRKDGQTSLVEIDQAVNSLIKMIGEK